MYNRDKRQMVRHTTNPVEVVSKIEFLAFSGGRTFEEVASALLERALDDRFSALGIGLGRGSYFSPIECLCCGPDAAMVEAV